jgi:hypothetical protein
MKSLRDWIVEQDMGMPNAPGQDGISRIAATNLMGGTVSNVDPQMKSMLKSEMDRIIRANEGVDPLTLFREIVSAVIALLGDIKGTRVTAKNIMDLSDLAQKEEGENVPQV